MPKRPDNLETLLLSLELLRRVPRTGGVSAPELHKQMVEAGFNRNLRTIQRQLELLSRHFDIERDDRSRPYVYRWKGQARGFWVSMLSEQEALLLTLAEQHLRNLLPSSLMKSLGGFFAQARSTMRPPGKGRREREWLEKVRVVSTSQPLLPPEIRPGVFEAVSNALYKNLWLTIDYENASGNRTKSDVMPLGLAQQGPRLYLVCRYPDFENERSLAMHRMRSAKPSTMTFERPEGFDLQRYVDDGRFGFGEGERIQLTFRILREVGQHLTETPLSTDQSIKLLGDEYEVRATVVDSLMLDQWLAGFGESVTKIRRQKIALRVQK